MLYVCFSDGLSIIKRNREIEELKRATAWSRRPRSARRKGTFIFIEADCRAMLRRYGVRSNIPTFPHRFWIEFHMKLNGSLRVPAWLGRDASSQFVRVRRLASRRRGARLTGPMGALSDSTLRLLQTPRRRRGSAPAPRIIKNGVRVH